MKPILASLVIAVAALFSLGAAAVEDVIEVDILRLTSIDWEPGKELPKSITDLNGREIAITGYMQSQLNKDVKTFMIIGDSCQCSGTPLPHHFVQITLDEKTGYRPGELSFIGKLAVGEELKDGFVTSIYRLEGKFL